jgi:hypothetical protein
MGSISILLAFALLFLTQAFPAPAQGSGLLGGEIQNIEKILQSSSTGNAERHDALIRLARLSALSGNLEAAAGAWLRAATVQPGVRDDRSLLEGVRCLIAMGQLDAAEEHVRTILLSGQNAELVREGRYLGSQIQVFRTGNGAALAALLSGQEYADKRPAMLYTLWRITGEEAYRIRLESEYPASPEARTFQDAATPVIGAPTAMWLLMPGREAVTLGEGARAVVPSGPPATGASGSGSGASGLSPQPPAGNPPPQAQASSGTGVPGTGVPGTNALGTNAPGSSSILQTGLFSREDNAKAMAERLRAAGFLAGITRRQVNGNNYWVVGVPPGDNMNATIMRLKDAGFESFPVFFN